jgi:hypothetical protein
MLGGCRGRRCLIDRSFVEGLGRCVLHS